MFELLDLESFELEPNMILLIFIDLMNT